MKLFSLPRRLILSLGAAALVIRIPGRRFFTAADAISGPRTAGRR